VRIIVFAVAVVFICAMAVLTVLDFENNGVTGLGIVGAIVVIVIGVGIIGALTEPPRKKK
jgi:lipopolysaccharide export LptBFGC system permease protein LptF